MTSEKRKLNLFGIRDFTTALTAIGLEAESGPLPYLEDAKLVKPYFVLERKDGKGWLYIDAPQVEWQKKELIARTKKDENYIPWLLEKTKNEYKKIGKILDDKKPLNLDELKKFAIDTMSTWRWYAGIWWAVEAFEENNVFPNFIELLMKFRKETEKFVPAADHIVRISINSIYPSLGNLSEVLSEKEALNGEVPEISILEDRYKHSLMIDSDVYIGKEIKANIEKSGIQLCLPKIEDHQQNANEVKGQIAYKGKYTGIVSIVITKEQANKFEKGKVLVSSTTTPDLIVAIKKAGAIVADEGGIISHAALCSREFKIPGIIGTKIGTQVFKDGDMVEVDAEKGVVRIIK